MTHSVPTRRSTDICPKELKDDDAGNDEGRHLTLACYGMLPATRSTDVLSQVERWTGFTQHFGHVSTGLPPGDEQAFLATRIAEATNRGRSRKARVCGAGSHRRRRDRACPGSEGRRGGRDGVSKGRTGW